MGEIEKINQLLTKLGEKGYSENIKIVIDIKENMPSFSIDDKNMENIVLRREKQKFDNLIKDMENKYQTDIIKKTNEIEKINYQLIRIMKKYLIN